MMRIGILISLSIVGHEARVSVNWQDAISNATSSIKSSGNVETVHV